MLAVPGLNACLFVQTHDEVINPQREAAPDAFVQIEDRAGFGSEVGVARENPAAMLPRPKSIAAEPAPQCRAADLSNETLRNHVLPDLFDR